MFNIICFDELESTNEFLIKNYDHYNNYDVIYCDNQTKGIGRFNRTWISNNDLTFSLLFKENQKKHNIIAPVSIVKALRKLNINAQIKWPNDILIDNKKVAGILVNRIFVDKDFFCDIIGIGINLSNKISLVDKATSISNYIKIEKKEIFNLILEEYKNIYLSSDNYVIDLYKSYNIKYNSNIFYKNKKYLIYDISNNGELILKNNEEIISVTSDEISLETYYNKKSERGENNGI